MLGYQEIIIILVIALLVFGPAKLPEIGRQVGGALRELRKMSGDVQKALDLDDHGDNSWRYDSSPMHYEPPSYGTTYAQGSVPAGAATAALPSVSDNDPSRTQENSANPGEDSTDETEHYRHLYGSASEGEGSGDTAHDSHHTTATSYPDYSVTAETETVGSESDEPVGPRAERVDNALPAAMSAVTSASAQAEQQHKES